MMSPTSLIVALLVLLIELWSTLAYNPSTSWKISRAFAALKTSGNVITWGDSNSSQVASSLSSGVSVIYSAYEAFAALKTDGSVSQSYHEPFYYSFLLLHMNE